MTAQELELHIKDLGTLMQASYADWAATGCFHARGQADRYRIDMQAAIAARSLEQVVHLEKIRGLAA